ncbi:unnamed protein product [Musa textilis]
MAKVEEIRRSQRAEGPATVLAIGTSNPDNVVYQADYPDYYFRTTKSNHLPELKQKFKRICELLIKMLALPDGSGEKTMIRKRYMFLNEEILKANPSVAECMAPSLDVRRDILAVEVPKLAKEAAVKAIEEWGHPKSRITHLVFCTTVSFDSPGHDNELVKLLGLSPSINRFALSQNGCFAGGTVLRLAKDLAENNRGARVLVVCSEHTAVTFRGAVETHLDNLVGQALFGDGTAAVIIGADPDPATGVPFPARLGQPDPPPRLRRRHRGPPQGGRPHLPSAQGRAQDHCQEHRAESQRGLRAVGDQRLELHLLDRAPRRTRDPRRDGGQAGAGEGKAAGDEAGDDRVREHVQRLRAVHPRRDEEAVGRGREGDHRRGVGVGVLYGFGPGLTVETVVLHSVAISSR